MHASQPKRVVIAGGSRFLGVSLAFHLAAANRQVTILSRHPPRPKGPWRHVPWDARSAGDWMACLAGAAGLVNLVGRTVDCVKTPDHCDEILRSRVEATRVLGIACRSVASPPPVWVQMSTAHIYGDPPRVWLGAAPAAHRSGDRALWPVRHEQPPRAGGIPFTYPRLPEALAACFAQPTRHGEPGGGAGSR